jgi:hypothetical protein
LFSRSRFRTPCYFALALVLALSIGACDSGQASTASPPASNRRCPAERCIDIDEANAVLGFDILEPSFIPDDFVLDRRELVEDLAPGAPVPGSTGAAQPLGPPSTILTDFRFRGSPALPGITLLQSSLGSRTLHLATPDCAEIISTESGPLFYIDSGYILDVSADGTEQFLCRDTSMALRDVHNVIAVRGDTLVEVIAFPEVRISKDEIIALVKSLGPAESDSALP